MIILLRLSLIKFFILNFLVIDPGARAQEVIDVQKSLLITSPQVVDAPILQDRWSFNSVLSRLGLSPGGSQILSWLEQWKRSDVGGVLVRPLDPKSLLRFWPNHEFGYDFARSPFLLTAIIYRPDLRSDSSGGEFRLSFGAFDHVSLQSLPFTLILEFEIPIELAETAREGFLGLSQIPFGDSFNEKLSALMGNLIKPETLLQLRTNDFLMNDSWDLREFVWQDGSLVMGPTKFAPPWQPGTSAELELLELVKTNREQILAGTYQLPKQYWGAMSIVPEEDFIWFEGKNIEPELREAFSLSTCNGCHAGTTGTRFMHISSRTPGKEADLSVHLENELKIRAAYLRDLRVRPYRYAH